MGATMEQQAKEQMLDCGRVVKTKMRMEERFHDSVTAADVTAPAILREARNALCPYKLEVSACRKSCETSAENWEVVGKQLAAYACLLEVEEATMGASSCQAVAPSVIAAIAAACESAEVGVEWHAPLPTSFLPEFSHPGSPDGPIPASLPTAYLRQDAGDRWTLRLVSTRHGGPDFQGVWTDGGLVPVENVLRIQVHNEHDEPLTGLFPEDVTVSWSVAAIETTSEHWVEEGPTGSVLAVTFALGQGPEKSSVTAVEIRVSVFDTAMLSAPISLCHQARELFEGVVDDRGTRDFVRFREACDGITPELATSFVVTNALLSTVCRVCCCEEHRAVDAERAYTAALGALLRVFDGLVYATAVRGGGCEGVELCVDWCSALLQWARTAVARVGVWTNAVVMIMEALPGVEPIQFLGCECLEVAVRHQCAPRVVWPTVVWRAVRGHPCSANVQRVGMCLMKFYDARGYLLATQDMSVVWESVELVMNIHYNLPVLQHAALDFARLMCMVSEEFRHVFVARGGFQRLCGVVRQLARHQLALHEAITAEREPALPRSVRIANANLGALVFKSVAGLCANTRNSSVVKGEYCAVFGGMLGCATVEAARMLGSLAEGGAEDATMVAVTGGFVWLDCIMRCHKADADVQTHALRSSRSLCRHGAEAHDAFFESGVLRCVNDAMDAHIGMAAVQEEVSKLVSCLVSHSAAAKATIVASGTVPRLRAAVEAHSAVPGVVLAATAALRLLQ